MPAITRKYLAEICGVLIRIVFRAFAYLKELEKYASDIYRAVESAWNGRSKDLSFIRIGESFKQCPSNSIDYAVLKHTDKAVVVPIDGGWNDMGSWEAFCELLKNSRDNMCIGSLMT